MSTHSTNPVYNITMPNINPVDKDYLYMSTIQIVGTIFLVFILIAILINSYFSGLILWHWESIKKSLYFNTNLLCFLLTLADLAFSVLLGFPAGLHMAAIKYFMSNTAMLYFTRKVAEILFNFIFFLRIIIIGVLSLDRCLHLVRPVQYSKFATKRRIMFVIAGIIAAPILVDLIPTLVSYFLNDAHVICRHFRDPDLTFESNFQSLVKHKSNFSVPLTCSTFLRNPRGRHSIVLFDLVIIMTITILAWFIIVVSNLSIIMMILKHAMKPINRDNSERRKKMTKNLVRSSMMVVFIALLFFITSFPYAWMWFNDYLKRHTNLQSSEHSTVSTTYCFTVTLLTFLPVLVHPWLYLLRMKTIKDLTPNITGNISSQMGKAIVSIQQYLPLPRKSDGDVRKLDVPNNTKDFELSPMTPRIKKGRL